MLNWIVWNRTDYLYKNEFGVKLLGELMNTLTPKIIFVLSMWVIDSQRTIKKRKAR